MEYDALLRSLCLFIIFLLMLAGLPRRRAETDEESQERRSATTTRGEARDRYLELERSIKQRQQRSADDSINHGDSNPRRSA